MDYKKIGKFILVERKAKNLTQEKLAQKLFVSAKTVSKWETGNGVPDTNILPKLCEIFNITINELLNGERISVKDYTNKAESKLLELQKSKEEGDKRLLFSEIVIGVFASLFLFSVVLIAAFIAMSSWLRIVLIVVGFIVFMVAMFYAIRIEQKVGFYECPNCHHKYIPTYNQVLWAMHFGRTRFMKCPHCHKNSWHKKVIK